MINEFVHIEYLWGNTALKLQTFNRVSGKLENVPRTFFAPDKKENYTEDQERNIRYSGMQSSPSMSYRRRNLYSSPKNERSTHHSITRGIPWTIHRDCIEHYIRPEEHIRILHEAMEFPEVMGDGDPCPDNYSKKVT